MRDRANPTEKIGHKNRKTLQAVREPQGLTSRIIFAGIGIPVKLPQRRPHRTTRATFEVQKGGPNVSGNRRKRTDGMALHRFHP